MGPPGEKSHTNRQYQLLQPTGCWDRAQQSAWVSHTLQVRQHRQNRESQSLNISDAWKTQKCTEGHSCCSIDVIKLHVSTHSDPLVTKLDFDKEPTPGPKHYPTPDNIREPLVQDKIPGKEEVQVQVFQESQVGLIWQSELI